APVVQKALWRIPGPFVPVIQTIENRLSSKELADAVAAGARQIAQNAMEPLDAKAGEQQYLSAHEFARHLEGYVLFKTGIGLSIKLKEKNASVRGKDFASVDIDAPSPVDQVALLHIHLPQIDGRNDLWKEALKNTWPKETATEEGRD